MWKQFGKFSLALAMFLEFKRRSDHEQLFLPAGHTCDALTHPNRRRQFGVRELFEPWLVVEEINVRRGAGHEQVDHALGARRKVKRFECAERLRGKGGA